MSTTVDAGSAAAPIWSGTETAVDSELMECESLPTPGLKRPAQDDISDQASPNAQGTKRAKYNDEGVYPINHEDREMVIAEPSPQPEPTQLSKNQQRKLKRQKVWEEKRHEKRSMRNQKRSEKKQLKRKEREAEIAAAAAEGREPVLEENPKRQSKPAIQVPVAIIIDCQFEKYMMDKELVSLGNQVTRCYSDNRNAQFPVHMFVSSYGGKMKSRDEIVLRNQPKSWKNVHFVEGDFVDAAVEAKNLMTSPEGGQVIDLLAQGKEGDSITLTETNDTKKKKSAPIPEPEADDVDKSIVYLTADSPYTLDRLEPNTSYVIGGIIDKNREKGLCYKVARGKKVRTAKLPIGEFMVMQSRHILATNHVMEIMLQWLETGDWGAAFMKVIPTRKGGKLKGDEGTPDGGKEESDKVTQEDQLETNADAVDGENIPSKATGQDPSNGQKSQTPIQLEGDNPRTPLTMATLEDVEKFAEKLDIKVFKWLAKTY